MNISIITEKNGWFVKCINTLIDDLKARQHNINIIHNHQDVPYGDILFALGYYRLIPTKIMERNHHNIVIHESDLPLGRGWSPLSWQVLEGKTEIVFSLFEMSEKVDDGDIYFKRILKLDGTELCDDLRRKQAQKKSEMCLEFIDCYPNIIQQAQKQVGTSTLYKKRDAKSSKLDTYETIAEQFNLLRIVDNYNYPAYFEYHGVEYKIHIYKK
ncbi:MAG: methionyl-tRNA formyltransferase [Candidatus Deianiraeaceae bacterium]|jgi:methionyl-tRNA formyltransferase